MLVAAVAAFFLVAFMKSKSLFLLVPATVVWVANAALADAVTFYDTQAGFDAAAKNASASAVSSNASCADRSVSVYARTAPSTKYASISIDAHLNV